MAADLWSVYFAGFRCDNLEASATAADPSLFLFSSWTGHQIPFFSGDGFQAVPMRFQSYRSCLIYPTWSYQRHERVYILGLVLCEDVQRKWSSVSAWHSYWWFLLGSHFCLVDVFRFHVPHSSVGKGAFSMFTTLTNLCIRAGSFWRCSAKFN